jgi:hypothetical protein
VIVGGKRFTDFSKHPGVVGVVTGDGPSTAAGRYQITGTTYRDVAPKLGVTDFSKESQDKIALELIRRKGALADVDSGNWEGAINKLGNIWASLPSSPYNQPKKTMEWSLAALNGQAAPAGSSYKPFANVRKDIDPKSLNADPDWLKASALLYELWEKKPYEGKSQSDLAEWGKDSMGNFNFNTVSMAQIAYQVSKGSQEQKEAFLYMLDSYDNTQFSMEGAGRAAKGIVTDPLNLVGVGTLGLGFAAKMAARNAAKEAAKQVVQRSMIEATKDAIVTGAVRTGVVAGMEGAVYGGAQSVIKQGVEVSAGRREEISAGKTAVDVGIGAASGLVLGTGMDVIASKASPYVGKAFGELRDMFKGTKEDGAAASKASTTAAAAAAPEAPATVPEAPTAASNAPGGTTPPESVAAPGRQQDGRLPADQVTPDMKGVDEPIIKVPGVENTGMRTTRVNGEPVAAVTKADVEKLAAPMVQDLKDLPPDQLPQALEQLRTGAFHPEQRRVVDNALRMFNGDLKREAAEGIKERDALLGKANRTPEEGAKLAELTAKVDGLLDRLATPGLADDAAGSMAGTILNDRRNGGASTSKITVESIMEEQGLTREQALPVWAEVVAKADQEAAVQKVVGEYESKIQAAQEAGDIEGAAKLAVQMRREREAMGEAIAPGSAGFVDKLKETAISNVFTATTVQLNFVSSAIKTLITPALKFVFGNSFEKAARAELGASYSAMRSSFGGAIAAARTAYRLEQSLLTRDGTRLVEGDLALSDTNKFFKWVPAGAIRFLPRVLNASDEFLSRMAYDSFVSGKAASEAAMEGAEKGLKGDALNAFIKEASETAVAASRSAEKGDDLVQPLINKGVNKGLTGDELWDWVEREAMRNPDALRKGTDEEALAYVRDLLYKRDFSGEGGASKIAQLYEKGAKAVPSWALVTGQLFFRTPIRVFEEGVRLTPGLQLLAPNFLNDLAGKNGMARQVKAQAESMTSLAIAGAVLSLYAQGRITGDGAYGDFKQQRNRIDGPLQAPYTIKMSDGSTWSYKLFDPIATPVKIMINALERADKLRLKQAQGEEIDDSLIEKAYSHVNVGLAAVLTAIKDANLVTGARMTAEIFTNAEDIEKHEDKWLKFMGEKMFLLVPNTLHKIAKDHDPGIRDPADFWQMVDEKLARSLGTSIPGVKTSMAYDPLGNVRRPSDTGTLWNIFSTASVEERTKGMSEESQAVMVEMDRLSRVTGATFKAPVQHKSLGDLDLRTVVAKDGKRTLYDVWQENYRALNPEVPLYQLAKSNLPDGTFAEKGAKAAAMQRVIGQLQEAAFAKLRMDEGEAINDQIESVIQYRAKAKAGLFDIQQPQ